MRNAGDNRGAVAPSSPTLSRRGLLVGLPVTGAATASAVAAVAAAVVPPIAGAAAPSSDAALIALCRRLAAIRDDWQAVLNVRHTIEDEERTEAQLALISAEYTAVIERFGALERIRPATWQGIQALAAAVLAWVPRDRKGQVDCSDDCDRMALAVVEAVAGAEVAAYFVALARDV